MFPHQLPEVSIAVFISRNKKLRRIFSYEKSWANQLAVIGQPVEDNDLIHHVFSGLNSSHSSICFLIFMSAILHAKSMSFNVLSSELLSNEIQFKS